MPMFDHKIFQCCIDTQSDLDRHTAFLVRQDPALQSAKLTCVNIPDIEPLHIHLSHQFSVGERDGRAQLVDDVETLAKDCLSGESMSRGSFTVKRENRRDQRFLGTKESEIEDYDDLAYSLARDVHFAFAEIQVTHGLGVPTAVQA